MVFDFCYKEQYTKYSFITNNKAQQTGTSVGLRDVKKMGIYQPTDTSAGRKLPKYNWVNEQVYVTPSPHCIFGKGPKVVDETEVLSCQRMIVLFP